MGAGRAQTIEELRQIGRVSKIGANKVRRRSRNAVALANREVGFDGVQERLMIGMFYRDRHESGQSSTKRRRVDNRSVTCDHTAIFQASYALDHRRARKSNFLRQRLHRQASVFLECGEDPVINRVDLTHRVVLTFFGRNRLRQCNTQSLCVCSLTGGWSWASGGVVYRHQRYGATDSSDLYVPAKTRIRVPESVRFRIPAS